MAKRDRQLLTPEEIDAQQRAKAERSTKQSVRARIASRLRIARDVGSRATREQPAQVAAPPSFDRSADGPQPEPPLTKRERKRANQERLSKIRELTKDSRFVEAIALADEAGWSQEADAVRKKQSKASGAEVESDQGPAAPTPKPRQRPSRVWKNKNAPQDRGPRRTPQVAEQAAPPEPQLSASVSRHYSSPGVRLCVHCGVNEATCDCTR